MLNREFEFKSFFDIVDKSLNNYLLWLNDNNITKEQFKTLENQLLLTIIPSKLHDDKVRKEMFDYILNKLNENILFNNLKNIIEKYD